MCGFLGVYRAKGSFAEADFAAFRGTFTALAHRGNTSSGESLGNQAALFHYRLAFRDLALGKQPLTDKLNRATIIFNGELYGFRPLRERLAAKYEFQTHSDTEVILAAYLAYGEDMLRELDGEYAFVIHDHRDGSVIAGRDPFGVKPLFLAMPNGPDNDFFRAFRPRYEFAPGNDFAFASEMKGLPFALAWDQRGWERSMLSLYEEMGTSFRNVIALAPGSLFVAKSVGGNWHASITRKIKKRRKTSSSSAFGPTFEQNSEELRRIIAQNVQNKLDAEVPLGAYLSGGIDSRIAAHEMGKSGAEIQTFTVGFEGADYDETPEVARFLKKFPNLRGRALKTDNSMLEYSYPHAIYTSELVQPYTNGSAKWWLSRFARKYVRGVLTGDGADELFCGYPSYRYLAWWQFYRRQKSDARATLYQARVVGKNEKFWEKGLSSLPDGTDLQESEAALGWAHPLYAQVSSLEKMLGTGTIARERADILSYVQPDQDQSPLTVWQNYFLHTHFPTHVLNWVGDRMEMANTLEGRPVYLSRACLEFFDRLPDGHLVRGLRDKAVLRKAYAGALGDFSATPKKQFNAPFLFDGALGREFLTDSALKETGLIDPGLVTRARALRSATADALERSFAEIFLQNCLVTQMLDRYLVHRQPPARDINYEDRLLTERTVNL